MGKKPPEGVALYDVFSCPNEVLGPCDRPPGGTSSEAHRAGIDRTVQAALMPSRWAAFRIF